MSKTSTPSEKKETALDSVKLTGQMARRVFPLLERFVVGLL